MRKTIFSWRTIVTEFSSQTHANRWMKSQRLAYNCFVRSHGWTISDTFFDKTGVNRAYTVEICYKNSNVYPPGW